jgi:hypothetical protein
MEGGQSPEPSPTDADVVQGVGSDPLFQCSLTDSKQRRAASLVLGAHDMHAPLVDVAGTAAAKVEREFFYLFARLRVEGDLAYRHPAIVAGVGALVGDDVVVLVEMRIMILSRWVRGYARLTLAAHGALTS